MSHAAGVSQQHCPGQGRAACCEGLLGRHQGHSAQDGDTVRWESTCNMMWDTSEGAWDCVWRETLTAQWCHPHFVLSPVLRTIVWITVASCFMEMRHRWAVPEAVAVSEWCRALNAHGLSELRSSMSPKAHVLKVDHEPGAPLEGGGTFRKWAQWMKLCPWGWPLKGILGCCCPFSAWLPWGEQASTNGHSCH
jgi:hypothetical protein